MRERGALYCIHGDHLGSTAITSNESHVRESELRYYPYGSTRFTSGTLPTDKRFTRQMLDEGTGAILLRNRGSNACWIS